MEGTWPSLKDANSLVSVYQTLLRIVPDSTITWRVQNETDVQSSLADDSAEISFPLNR
jgi:hypothetical protein